MRRVDALMGAMVGSGGPGAAAVLVRGGEVVYQGCFGLADLEWRQPVGPDTVFAIASLTKPFTATVVMSLHRDGLLDLDAPLGTYLPDYPGEGRRATVRHLLTHTSGIPNFLRLPGFGDGAAYVPHTPEDLLAVFAGLPLDFEPGTRYGYSNSGYRLLDLIVERVAAAPFAEVMAERVLEPAGMTSARMLTDQAVIPRRARGYENAGTAAPHISMTIPGGAGGLAASIEDMVAFDRALREHRLVDEATDLRMRTPQRLASGRPEGYGLGWVLTRYRGTPVVAHNGGLDGFSTLYARFPERDASIVVLSNRDGFPCGRLGLRIADEALGLPAPAERAADAGPVPGELAGTYRDTNGEARLTVEDGRLLLHHGGLTHRMVALGEGRYRAEYDDAPGLRVHDAGTITVDYPFTWFTGYR